MPSKTPARAVYANGVRYSNAKEAAAALGIGAQALYARIRKWPECYYYDPAQGPMTRRQYGPLSAETRERIASKRRKPVRIHGVTYGSIREAAAALGVPESTLGWRVLSKQVGYAPA